MRQITKESEQCECCGKITKHEEYEEFCDICGKNLGEFNRVHGYMDFTWFPHDYPPNETERYMACSWTCFFKWINDHRDRILSDELHFISMPSINDTNAEEFFEWYDSSKQKENSLKDGGTME